MDSRIERYRDAWRVMLLVATMLFAGLVAAPVAAVESVGRVIVSTGDVTVVRPGTSARSIERGDRIYEGDEIRTGRRGNAQIRFVDGALFDLDPDTRFAVDRYRSGEGQSAGSALMSFLSGALRTITGAIGRDSDDLYRMRTPTATIGVRGTGYSLYYCDANCADSVGGEPGLHGRVEDGGIRINTPRGSGDFGAGSFFFVPQGGMPRVVLQPPAGILDDIDEAAGEDVDPGEVAEAVIERFRDADPRRLRMVRRMIAAAIFESADRFDKRFVGGGVAAAGFVNQTGFSAAQFFNGFNLQVNSSGAVIGAKFKSGLNIAVAGATLDESGTVPGLNVGWGRWNGTFVVNGNPAVGNLAFAISNNLTRPARLAGLTGKFNYGSPQGPAAFDQGNVLWTVNALDLAVDFDALAVGLNQFDLSETGGQRLSFTSTDKCNCNLDIANNVVRLGVTNAGGGTIIDGRFVGTNGEGMIVDFVVKDADTPTQVTGTKVLQR